MPDALSSGDPMEALYALQSIDDSLDRLQEEQESSPLVRKVKEARSRLEVRRSQWEQAKAREGELRRSLRRLELDLETTSEEIAAVEAKLFGGEARGAKELSSLQERHEALERRKERLEEEVLASMEAVESAEEATAKAERLVAGAEEAAAASQGELAKAQTVWEAESQQLVEARRAAAARIAPQYLDRYEDLRRRMRRPIAKVENRTCSGCHVAFPTGMKASRPGELSQCPHCGRLLWWPRHS